VETFTAFLLSVVVGAQRFAHASMLRADAVLHALLGMTEFPVDDTIRHLFQRFGQGQSFVAWIASHACDAIEFSGRVDEDDPGAASAFFFLATRWKFTRTPFRSTNVTQWIGLSKLLDPNGPKFRRATSRTLR
jgi:hypothetical protein